SGPAAPRRRRRTGAPAGVPRSLPRGAARRRTGVDPRLLSRRRSGEDWRAPRAGNAPGRHRERPQHPRVPDSGEARTLRRGPCGDRREIVWPFLSLHKQVVDSPAPEPAVPDELLIGYLLGAV